MKHEVVIDTTKPAPRAEKPVVAPTPPSRTAKVLNTILASAGVALFVSVVIALSTAALRWGFGG